MSDDAAATKNADIELQETVKVEEKLAGDIKSDDSSEADENEESTNSQAPTSRKIAANTRKYDDDTLMVRPLYLFLHFFHFVLYYY